MKNTQWNIFGIVVLIICSNFYANAQMESGFHYKIKNSYKPLFHCSPIPLNIYYTKNGNKIENNKVQKKINPFQKKGLKANIIQDTKNPNILKVDFWGINSLTDKYKSDTDIVNSSFILSDSNYFFLEIEKRKKMSDLINYISVPYATTEFGVTTIPFKYRFGNKKNNIPNDASMNIDGGIYIGRKWGRTRFFQDSNKTSNSLSLTLAGFVAPTVIALTKNNISDTTIKSSNELGIGIGAALLVSYRDINIGILSGIDIPISGESNKWIYSYRPWIGFGIGYKLAILGAGK